MSLRLRKDVNVVKGGKYLFLDDFNVFLFLGWEMYGVVLVFWFEDKRVLFFFIF